MSFLSSRWAATAIVLLAIALRLAAGAWWQTRLPPAQPFLFGDSITYWSLGQRLADGRPYEFGSPAARVFRMPGYPLLLAGMFRIVGDDASVLWGRGLSALLGGAATLLVIYWARWLFDPTTGLLAGALAAVYPGAIAMGVFVLSEAPFCPLMIGHLWLWGQAARAASVKAALALAAGSGLVAGLATLVRPSWLLFLPLALIVALAFGGDRRRHAAVGLVACLAMVVCLLPWWIRNARLTGHFVPTTLQVGASLYDGLSPQATGASDMRFVPEATARLEAEDANRPVVSEPFELRLDRQLGDEALAWAEAHPGQALQLAGVKFLRLWNVWPNEATFRSWPLRLAMLLSYVPLVACGWWGAWRLRHRGWPLVLAWLPAVYFSLLHMVFVSSIRYREPAMLGLIVLAAGVLSRQKPGVAERPIAPSFEGGS